jgi:hypothetical protein
MSESTTTSLYEGLKALVESTFPKKCNNCGAVYETAEEFIEKTQIVRADHSGLKSTEDFDGSTIVELFRNCHCGSTLMDTFSDRRDLSESGEKRRQNFNKIMQMVQKRYNLEENEARNELLKIMRGQSSEVIKDILPSKRKSN